MKISTVVFGFLWLVSTVSSQADVQLGKEAVVHFAAVSEGRQLLSAKDDFIRRLSSFDRSARMKVDRPVTEEELLAFIERNVAEWTTDEIQKVQGSFEQINVSLRDRSFSMPLTLQLIKTTGAEEGNAAYTRGTAIVIPQSELKKSGKELGRLISHELFHVLSRQSPELRRKLYAIIGFAECDEITFPAELAARKITNPDAPRNDHFIQLENEGRAFFAMPILLSTTTTYDPKRGGEFFNYLSFQFLEVEKTGDARTLKPVYENGVPKLIEPRSASKFFEQIGKNTDYIIHPEEILAENFALLISGDKTAPSPEILRKMQELLFK